MKKICSFLIIFTIVFNGHSQVNFDFPDSNAIWVNTISLYMGAPYFDCTNPSSTNYCVNGEDTLINSTSYTQVKICDINSYVGGWRDSSGVVFFIPADSTNEYLLYDFTVQAGDTIPEVWMSQEVFNDIVVYEVDSTLIWGEYRKVINVGEFPWIEGIGCTQGLFQVPWGNLSDICFELHCMSDNDTILYPSENLGSCDLGVGFEENFDLTIDLYPNPSSTGSVLVKSEIDLSKSHFLIFNSLGQSINTGLIENHELFISNKSGIYYVQIISNFGTVTKRVIVD